MLTITDTIDIIVIIWVNTIATILTRGVDGENHMMTDTIDMEVEIQQIPEATTRPEVGHQDTTEDMPVVGTTPEVEIAGEIVTEIVIVTVKG